MTTTIDAARRKLFCRAYLRTLDPDRAAAKAGIEDGWGMLHNSEVQKELKRLREDLRTQTTREDALRRLTELAFGRANDAAALALSVPGQRPEVDELDLSAISELKVSDKGVEIKLLDRVRALETLCGLLSEGGGMPAFLQALKAAGAEGSGE